MTDLPRILVVDDEEAILETMAFTFADDYEVYTSTDARRALDILDEKSPIAVVLTDERMPGMSGVEFVTEVCKRHPATVRMILTGFADMEAIIEAINGGHVYAYLTKPWEQEQLKQLMMRAVEHYNLTIENQRLLEVQTHANRFLEAVMDQFEVGAIAVDDLGVIQAVNRPVRHFLGLDGDLQGRQLKEVLDNNELAVVAGAAMKIAEDEEVSYDEVEITLDGRIARLRVKTNNLFDDPKEPDGTDSDKLDSDKPIGRVILLREISHEPLQRDFDDILQRVVRCEGELRPELENAQNALRDLLGTVKESSIESAGMGELAQRLSRTMTSVDNWLGVDDVLAKQDFPDAQLLKDRIRVSMTRWPFPDEIPERVRMLARRVEEYYESGENTKQRVL